MKARDKLQLRRTFSLSIIALRLLTLDWNARTVVLVHVAMMFLDKAFLADFALISSQLQMTSYMVFHVA